MARPPRTDGALRFAATGASLFLGVGAALPDWEVVDGWGLPAPREGMWS